MPDTELQSHHIDPQSRPYVGSVWRHHSGRLYTVLMLTNENSDRQDRFPTTVCYQGQNGHRWSRPLVEFTDKMEPAQ